MTPPLSLEELVRTGTYRNARHKHLLAEAPVLPWIQLAELQSAYVRTDHPLEKDELAREFARRIRTLNDDLDEQAAREAEQAEFEALLHEVDEVDDLSEPGNEFERWTQGSIVTYCRGAGMTWREVSERTGLTVGRARRALEWWARGRE